MVRLEPFLANGRKAPGPTHAVRAELGLAVVEEFVELSADIVVVHAQVSRHLESRDTWLVMDLGGYAEPGRIWIGPAFARSVGGGGWISSPSDTT